MTEKRNWFARPAAALCLFGGAAVLSVFVLLGGSSRRDFGTEISYMVTLRIYGTDAREMERTAAIPLEDALSSIPGMNRVLTLSENSRVRAYAVFGRDRRNRRAYEAVRDAAQRVYETLPSSAQRPELGSSDDSRVPVWIAAVWGSPSGDYLEKTLKPAQEGLEGVGEVEISGPGITEIIIIPNAEKCAARNLSPRMIARTLAMNDGRFPGGSVISGGREILITADGVYPDLWSLGEALIPLDAGGAVRLGDIAEIREEEREGEILSRLDGKKTAVISITAASGADPGALSRRIREELKKFAGQALEFRILQDRGAGEERAFNSVLLAALEASVLVALTAALLTGKKMPNRIAGLVCAGSVPLILIISTAVLSRLGFPPDRKMLAGLSVGIGAASDAVILCAEKFGGCRDCRDGGKVLSKLMPPLVAGAATTVAALFPLSWFSLAGDMSAITLALGTVTLVSLAAALTVLPPLFLLERKPALSAANRAAFTRIVRPGENICRSFRRKGTRLLATAALFSLKKPLAFPLVSLCLSVSGAAALFFAGADISVPGSGDSVYARVEFEGGFLKEEGDRLLASWARELKNHQGIERVQTSARTGSGQILVTFDPRKLKEAGVRERIRSTEIPGGFIYIPETSADERAWEITVSGDDDATCRRLAGEAAGLCAAMPLVRETVLNFKEGNPRLILSPRRERLAEGGTNFSFTAETVRMGVYGPVIYKRVGEKGETDVRLRLTSGQTAETPAAEQILDLPLALPGTQGKRTAGSLVSESRDREPSVIRREDRRRTASFSIRTGPMDPRQVREKIMPALKNMELPPGYRLEFDREAIKKAEALSGTAIRFLLALLFCYMVIAAASESPGLPLVVLASVPPSLAVPILVLALSGSPLNAAMACSLVAVSGMAVNASVLVAGEFKELLAETGFSGQGTFYFVLRNRLPCLLATSGTTLAGALPFLFLREGSNAMVRTLSLVMVLGVGASLIISVTLIPSLVKLFWNHKEPRTNKMTCHFRAVPKLG
jgi:multidrug efflux pump subunit AcrB